MIRVEDYLNGHQIAALDEIYAAINGYAENLQHNVAIVEHLVDQLEGGYGPGSEDFINQLGYRGLLDMIMAEAPMTAVPGLKAIIEALDVRFNQATQPGIVHTPWYEFFDQKPWADRIPVHFGSPDFREYLVRRGCIQA